MKIAVASAILVLGFAVSPSVLSAQIRASELGSVSQTIDGTTIDIEYSRPMVRGRDNLFGGVVHWGEVWTPGANYSAKLEVDKKVWLNGVEVEPGDYSMWLVVEPGDSWRGFLDPRPRIFHTQRPDSAPGQIWFEAEVGEGPFFEGLTFHFAEVRPTGATLALNWGETVVNMDIRVQPSHPMTFAADRSGAFIGEYSMESQGQGLPPVQSTMEVSYQDGRLMGEMKPAIFGIYGEFVMMESMDSWFNPGWVDGAGAVWDVWPDITLEFEIEDGRAVSYEIRDDRDRLVAAGTRK